METLGQEEIELTFQNRSSSVILGTLVNLSSCSAGKSLTLIHVLIEPPYLGVEEEMKSSKRKSFLARSPFV